MFDYQTQSHLETCRVILNSVSTDSMKKIKERNADISHYKNQQSALLKQVKVL